MIRGQVTSARADGSGLEARVAVDIAAANLIYQSPEVVVDTGDVDVGFGKRSPGP